MYRASSYWGRRVVEDTEAQHVYATWADGRGQYIEGDLEHGFIAWSQAETGERLMSTKYEPIPEGES